MKHRLAPFSAPLGVVALLSVLLAKAAYAQELGSAADPSVGTKPLLVLTEMSAPPGDPVADKLAVTLTETLSLDLQLTGAVTLQRADFLDPTNNLERTLKYYRQVGANAAVYGSVAPAKSGSYAIDLNVWNGDSAAKSATVRRSISNLLTSFGLVDKLSLDVASTVVGHKLSEGTLVVKNTSILPTFSVYADGQLLAKNRNRLPLLTGSREIIIAKPEASGDVPVEFFHVTIQEGKTTTVILSNAGRRVVAAHAPGARILSAGSASRGLAVGTGNFPLRFEKATGVFGHPSLVYGSRTYTLATKDEYAWAVALLSNLPGITQDMRARLSEVRSEVNQARRRRGPFVALSALALGGVGATAYAFLRPNQTLLTTGMVVGIASLAAAIPTRMLESDSTGKVDANISSVISEYKGLPFAVRNQGHRRTYFISTSDFSGTQGKNNWYYGYSGNGAHARFELMPVYNHAYGFGEWWQDYANWWTGIWAHGMGPGEPRKGSGGLSNAIRRFVVPADGVYHVEADFERDFHQGAPVTFSLRKNDISVWSRTLLASDASSHSKVDTISCRRGDTIDFVASMVNNAGYANLTTMIVISRKQ